MRCTLLLREYLFPANCAICGRMLFDKDECWYGLCHVCIPRFGLDLDAPRCSVCGRPLVSEQGCCMNCRNTDDHTFDQALALFPYIGQYQKLLSAFKFDKRRALGTFLGEKLLESLAYFPGLDADTVLTPVPPRAGKLRNTGWDQIACLATILERTKNRSMALPVYRCLRRLPSQSQKELSRDSRKTNLRGRIRCVKKAPRRAIVFDDVITTGSTLDACATALKEAGAEQVYGLCLFYT
ncbi:MAG: double zinc ribbon domain-containing protein [Treponema sp.]|nr:double zinc ribbon domain-containing protein [Treponema sp.]